MNCKNFADMSTKTDISSLRRHYSLESLSESDVHPDPIHQFEAWFDEALDSQLAEPNAMTLATADRNGRPSARTVLLKGFDEDGFVFYTNFESRKGVDLFENPQAALLFTWLELERQIRIEGTVEKVSAATSEIYFHSRPKASQIGAWSSPQSKVIPDRSILEQKVAELSIRYADAMVLPLPPHWGGYRVRPEHIEFWQGRESRLHDRILYTRSGDDWKIQRLAP
jgi:pyridoxamine 5'-phosphate oxidase